MKSVGLTGGIGLGSNSPPGLGERMTVGLTGGIGMGKSLADGVG